MRKIIKDVFSGVQSVSNFRPTAASAIYDRYLNTAWRCAGSEFRIWRQIT
jgi:hypothetical protein